MNKKPTFEELKSELLQKVKPHSPCSSEYKRAGNPKYEASEGFTRAISLKDAWKNAWGNWSDENKAVFTSLENFDAKKFEEITGIKL